MKIIVLGICISFIWFFIQVNIHEFGHLCMGKLLGYKLVSYAVGPFKWYIENKKLRFKIQVDKSAGAMCAMVPSNNVSRRQQMLYISGGVLFQGISVMIIVIMGLKTGNLKLSVALGLISMALIILNGVPLKNMPFSDGSIFFALYKNNDDGKKLNEVFKITNLIAMGTRFKDIDFKNIDTLNGENYYVDIHIELFKYFKALEEEDLKKVIEKIRYFEGFLDMMPDHLKIPIIYEFVYFYSRINKDEEKAKKYFNRVEKHLKKDFDINGRRVFGIYKIEILKEREEGIFILKEGLKNKDKFVSLGQGLLEEKLIKEYI